MPSQLLVAAPCFPCSHLCFFWIHWLTFLPCSTCILWKPLIYVSVLPLLRGTLSCLPSGNRMQILLCLPNLASNSLLTIFSGDGYGHEMQCFHLVEVPRFLGEQDGRCAFCPDSVPQHIHKTLSVPKQGEKETRGSSLLHVLIYSCPIL